MKWQGKNLRTSCQGMIILEAVLGILVILVIGTISYQCLLSTGKSYRSVMADLAIYRADRYTQNLLTMELCRNTRVAKIRRGAEGQELVLQNNLGHVRKTLYLRNQTLYKKTQTSDTEGINPLSAAELRVLEWHWEPKSHNTLMLKWRLEEKQSGRIREFVHIYTLFNGRISD
jgi:hypothetical protein